MDNGALEVVEARYLGDAHLVQARDLAEVVAGPDGIGGQSRGRGATDFELLAGVDAVGSQIIEFFELIDIDAVGAGDFP